MRVFSSLIALMFLLFSVPRATAWSSQSKLVEELKKEAAAGDADAAFHLGLRYDQGDGVHRDLAEAATWYRSAAEKGNVEAQNSLGNLLMSGTGVSQNYAQALEWFSKASAAGNLDALVSLAYLYDEGLGVPEDNSKSVALYEQAAERGSVRAMLDVGVTFAFGDKGIDKDQVRGYTWLEIGRFLTQTSPDKSAKWQIRGALDKLKESMPLDKQQEGNKRASDWLAAHKVL